MKNGWIHDGEYKEEKSCASQGTTVLWNDIVDFKHYVIKRI